MQQTTTQEESKYFILLSAGVLSVMMIGIIATVPLSVISWASMGLVQPGCKLTMAKEVVQYCLTMFVALVMNHTFGSAVTLGGRITTVTILKMLVLTAINNFAFWPI